MVFLPAVALIFSFWQTNQFSLFSNELWQSSRLLMGYFVGCLIISPYFLFHWVVRKFIKFELPVVGRHEREVVDIRKRLSKPLTHGLFSKALGWLPFNQATKLAIEKIRFDFAKLPQAVSGLKIAHLSDLHLTGQIELDYFRELVKITNDFEPDLIVITGDLVDEAECLDWIAPIFGELRAKLGAYFVLGNHDLRIKDREHYLKLLKDSGLIRLKGHWQSVEVNGATLALAGNELPWFAGAESLPQSPDFDADFKILLSHSPDQLEWAASYDFDLMLAGHTHGGQIQFPVIGPVVAPSKFGVKYASGIFQLDKMLMYVSRGISGDEPIRINCLPELGLFELNAATPKRLMASERNKKLALGR